MAANNHRPYPFDSFSRQNEPTRVEFQPLRYPSHGNSVSITQAEHEYLIQEVREYHLLKSALFRGGLTQDTLDTLLDGEREASVEPDQQDTKKAEHPARWSATSSTRTTASEGPKNTANGKGYSQQSSSNSSQRHASWGDFEYSDEETHNTVEINSERISPTIPVQDQRTVLISNLHESTTHKDLADIIRGGRLLEIYIRNDKTARVSFIEGAADFLAYTKRNDVYVHMKRLEFRWSDWQFHVPSHVSNKIAGGATRNLVVRGIAGKITADRIRDHLDHIHNLVVVDIRFKDRDVYISTNSIHNALFARTCMMSRGAYKGFRIEYYPDECAGSLPQHTKPQSFSGRTPTRQKVVANHYAVLGTTSDTDSDPEDDLYTTSGVSVDGYTLGEAVLV